MIDDSSDPDGYRKQAADADRQAVSGNIYQTRPIAEDRAPPPSVDFQLVHARSVARNKFLAGTFLLLGFLVIALWIVLVNDPRFQRAEPETNPTPGETLPAPTIRPLPDGVDEAATSSALPSASSGPNSGVGARSTLTCPLPCRLSGRLCSGLRS